MTREPALSGTANGQPQLSVVVASVNGMPYLERCLDSLPRGGRETEVIVADWTDEHTRRRVREGWPHVRLLSFDEPMAVPELRAAGILAARSPHVALIEDHCVVTDQWAERLLDAHDRGYSVVGGPVRNGATMRIRDWAAFLCEYSAHMEPLQGGEVPDLVGMNVSYDRRALAAIDDLVREGRWESWLHPRLRTSGFVFYCDEEAVIDHVKDFGIREFLSQRYHYSRSYAGMRNAQLGWKRAIFAGASPLLVPLMYYRIAGNVWRRRRPLKEFALATPLIILYSTVWAVGEGVGYAFGGGRSLLHVR
jgi:glycosyltransferase involved in cell wall biosynthesis